jgi:DNA polymerase III subunit chi
MNPPEVQFHLVSGDLTAYACRLIRKGHLKGARLVVQAEGAMVAAIDRQLWLMEDIGFIPHALAGDAPSLRDRSPVVLCEVDAGDTVADVLVNIGQPVPDDIAGRSRIFELVGPTESDRQLARLHWATYKARGHHPVLHDLSKGGGA